MGGGKQIGYDKNTRKFNVPDRETAQQFAEFVGDTDLVSKTRQNALDETLAEIGNYLGVGSTGVVAGVGRTVVGLGAMALGKKMVVDPLKKSLPSQNTSSSKGVSDNPISNSSGKNSNSEADDIDSKHGKSFNSDMQNYTENRNSLQEEFKDIGKQKQDLAAKYNSGKMSKEDYTSKSNSLDAKQMSITNDLDHIDRAIQHEEIKAEAENNKKTINRMPEWSQIL